MTVKFLLTERELAGITNVAVAGDIVVLASPVSKDTSILIGTVAAAKPLACCAVAVRT